MDHGDSLGKDQICVAVEKLWTPLTSRHHPVPKPFDRDVVKVNNHAQPVPAIFYHFVETILSTIMWTPLASLIFLLSQNVENAYTAKFYSYKSNKKKLTVCLDSPLQKELVLSWIDFCWNQHRSQHPQSLKWRNWVSYTYKYGNGILLFVDWELVKPYKRTVIQPHP